MGTLLVSSEIEMLFNLQGMNTAGYFNWDSWGKIGIHIASTMAGLIMQFFSIIAVSVIILKLPETLLRQSGVEANDEVGDSLGDQMGNRGQRYTDVV